MTAADLENPFVAVAEERPEFPSAAGRRREAEPEPAPKWKNLTLDELQAWADEENRREGMHNAPA
jgi:hypothetical protein